MLGFDFLNAFLSFAPGGIHEMVIISYAYEIDPIFISYHHFLRLIVIVVCLPVIFKIMNK
ncbi:AbrB family transcriptional regulator [Candidatus Pelagibacter ubique]|nr:AbrB family transcriptional regulator [Candidatus Pelagibacter ubique]